MVAGAELVKVMGRHIGLGVVRSTEKVCVDALSLIYNYNSVCVIDYGQSRMFFTRKKLENETELKS